MIDFVFISFLRKDETFFCVFLAYSKNLIYFCEYQVKVVCKLSFTTFEDMS